MTFTFRNQKDIEFVIPPTKPPSTTLYGPAFHRNNTESRNSNSENQKTKSEPNSGKKDDSVVNRSWNFIADVLTATSTLKASGERARSRDSLPVHNNNNSLDIPTIKTRYAFICSGVCMIPNV